MNKNLIIISALWCTSCLIVSNNLKQIVNQFPQLNIVNLDFDIDEDKVKEYNVGNMLPVMILQDENGNELHRLVGEKTPTEIYDFLNIN